MCASKLASHKYSVQYANEAVQIYTNKPTYQLPEQLQTNGESNTSCFKVLRTWFEGLQMTFENFSPYCLESVAAETSFMVKQQAPSSCKYKMRLHIIQHEINFYNKILKCFLFLLIYL